VGKADATLNAASCFAPGLGEAQGAVCSVAMSIDVSKGNMIDYVREKRGDEEKKETHVEE